MPTTYVTWHEKTLLMCTKILTAFYTLNFNNVFCLSIIRINKSFFNIRTTANNWKSNKIYRTCVVYTECEIIELM